MIRSRPSTTRAGQLLLCAAALLAAEASADPFTLFGKTLDTDWATTRAEVTGGGYATPFSEPNDVALPSDTSADWDFGNSLGTFFSRPFFQQGYSESVPVPGDAGTAVTLGQDPGFPPTTIMNPREIILLRWDSGWGVTDATGDDLGIFEQATSEAFALQVHVTAGDDLGWSGWFYVPYERVTYDADNDATPTWIDLTLDLGLDAGVVINAIEIANLIAEDTVTTAIDGTNYGLGSVKFEDDSGLPPGRRSGPEQDWKGFAPGKYDPDIQYVTSLRTLTSGVSDAVSALDIGVSGPTRLPPFGSRVDVPLPGVPALLLSGLALLGLYRSR